MKRAVLKGIVIGMVFVVLGGAGLAAFLAVRNATKQAREANEKGKAINDEALKKALKRDRAKVFMANADPERVKAYLASTWEGTPEETVREFFKARINFKMDESDKYVSPLVDIKGSPISYYEVRNYEIKQVVGSRVVVAVTLWGKAGDINKVIHFVVEDSLIEKIE